MEIFTVVLAVFPFLSFPEAFPGVYFRRQEVSREKKCEISEINFREQIFFSLFLREKTFAIRKMYEKKHKFYYIFRLIVSFSNFFPLIITFSAISSGEERRKGT